MMTVARRLLLLTTFWLPVAGLTDTARADGEDDSGLMSWGVDTTNEVAPDSGEEYFAAKARGAHTYGVGLRYGSLLGDPAVGLEGFWIPDQDIQLGLDVHSSTSNLRSKMDPDPLVGLAGITGRTDEAVAFARFFFHSAIYAGGGLGYRRARANWELYELAGDRRQRGETDTTGLVVDLRVGGQWAWQNGFYVSADLADGTLSLTSETKTQRVSGATSPELESVVQTAIDRGGAYGRASNWQILGFTAGYMFK